MLTAAATKTLGSPPFRPSATLLQLPVLLTGTGATNAGPLGRSYRGLDSKPNFTLTLQAREQHICYSEATSNICTNQGFICTNQGLDGDRRYAVPVPTGGVHGLEQVALPSRQHIGASGVVDVGYRRGSRLQPSGIS